MYEWERFDESRMIKIILGCDINLWQGDRWAKLRDRATLSFRIHSIAGSLTCRFHDFAVIEQCNGGCTNGLDRVSPVECCQLLQWNGCYTLVSWRTKMFKIVFYNGGSPDNLRICDYVSIGMEINCKVFRIAVVIGTLWEVASNHLIYIV